LFPWGGVNTDSRRMVSAGMWVNLWYTDEGKSHGSSLSPYVNFRPSPQTQINIGSGFSHDNNDSQWLDNFTANNGTVHYAFAHLFQRTVSMNTRVNYTVTPNLTFELYAEPFVTTGRYTNVREVSPTPDASSYDARFRAYTPPSGTSLVLKYTQLRSNSVVRWEYRPGSTLFLVWAHGRTGDPADKRLDRSWSSDYGELFSEHPDNTFLIKLAYWMNR